MNGGSIGFVSGVAVGSPARVGSITRVGSGARVDDGGGGVGRVAHAVATSTRINTNIFL
jgi:hypothetical protein